MLEKNSSECDELLKLPQEPDDRYTRQGITSSSKVGQSLEHYQSVTKGSNEAIEESSKLGDIL